MYKRGSIRVLYVILFVLQVLTEALIGVVLVRLNVLPGLYLTGLILVMTLAAIGTGCMYFIRTKKNIWKRIYITGTKVLAMILSVLIIVGSLYASLIIYRVNKTVDRVTDPGEISDVIGVYVRMDDPAYTIGAAKDYIFGITYAYDADNTTKTIAGIEHQVSNSINMQEYNSVAEMVQALYDEDTQAMILNTAYASILTDFDEFADFDLKIRLLWEFTITRPRAESKTGEDDTEEPEDEPNDQGKRSVTDITKDPFIVYLSGSDTRSQVLTTSRSDTNILMVVNPVTKEILLVNTPRDYYVQISIGGGAYDKLTHCGIYGIDCSMDTLESLYGIEIDYDAQINFTGFERLIDAIGGITVQSDYAWDNGNYHFVVGENYLHGAEALSFARERHAFASGDNQRGRNQMKVITGVIRRLTSSAVIIQNYAEILDSIQDMFTTSVSSDEISQLVRMQLGDMAEWSIHSYAVTGSNGSSTTFSMPNTNTYVMYPDVGMVNQGTTLINRVLDGGYIYDDDVE